MSTIATQTDGVTTRLRQAFTMLAAQLGMRFRLSSSGTSLMGAASGRAQGEAAGEGEEIKDEK